MAKTINTRIKNKVSDISSWNSSSVNKVDSDIRLLDGEIAIVRVPTGGTYTNPVTGKDEPVVELLMKVGDGSTVFSQLPWLSAKASDVYDWAKTQDIKDVKVKVVKGTDSTATESTLATWLKTTYDAGVTNATAISGLNTTVTKLDNADTVSGSVRNLIKTAIEGLDAKTEQGSGNFVKAVTQVDGKIQVTKGTIAESELPNISASKIVVTPASGNTAAVTLDTKLVGIDTDITNLKNRQVGHTDTQINTLIDNKINNLDSVCSTTGSYVTNVTQANGIVTVTKGNLPTASTSTAGITTLGAKDGAATYNSIFGTDGKGGINAQVETNKTDIANLKSAVAGGVHFRGTVTAKPTTASVTVNGSTSITAIAGDVVLWAAEGIEYIYTGSAWEELGDVTRLGDLETKINNLDVTETNAVANTHKFVSQVTQTDGKIAVTYTQPTSADVSHDGGTVATKLAAHDTEVAKLSDIGTNAKVGATIDSKITTALDGLDFTSPSTTNATATEFIDTVSQENGKISATKKKLPTASTTVAGIVKLNNTVTSTSTSEAATANAVKTAYDKADDAYTLASGKANENHEHSEYVNQNAFSKIKVGSTTVEADTAVDTVEFVGSNITITPDATNDKITFTVAKADADGETGIVTLEDSVVNQSTTAATSKAVYSVNTKAEDAQTRVGAVEGNYVRYNDTDKKLYVGKSGTEEIIFDCGGAPV